MSAHSRSTGMKVPLEDKMPSKAGRRMPRCCMAAMSSSRVGVRVTTVGLSTVPPRVPSAMPRARASAHDAEFRKGEAQGSEGCKGSRNGAQANAVQARWASRLHAFGPSGCRPGQRAEAHAGQQAEAQALVPCWSGQRTLQRVAGLHAQLLCLGVPLHGLDTGLDAFTHGSDDRRWDAVEASHRPQHR